MVDPYLQPPPCETALSGSAVVGTSSVKLTGWNPRRRRLIFSTPNLNRVWISFGQAAVAGAGYELTPAGIPWPLSADNVGASIVQDVFAISENAGETIPFLEVVE